MYCDTVIIESKPYCERCNELVQGELGCSRSPNPAHVLGLLTELGQYRPCWAVLGAGLGANHDEQGSLGCLRLGPQNRGLEVLC